MSRKILPRRLKFLSSGRAACGRALTTRGWQIRSVKMSNSDAAEPPREEVQQRESLVNYENAFSFFSEAHGIPCAVPGTAMDAVGFISAERAVGAVDHADGGICP